MRRLADIIERTTGDARDQAGRADGIECCHRLTGAKLLMSLGYDRLPGQSCLTSATQFPF